jgi:hypothetical protein
MFYADRVKETTLTTGVGTYQLEGAAVGFRGFVAAGAAAHQVIVVVTDNTDWEIIIGTVTDATPDTLTRDRVLASSNAGAAVNWTSGAKNVVLTLDASTLGSMVRNRGPQDVLKEALFLKDGSPGDAGPRPGDPRPPRARHSRGRYSVDL